MSDHKMPDGLREKFEESYQAYLFRSAVDPSRPHHVCIADLLYAELLKSAPEFDESGATQAWRERCMREPQSETFHKGARWQHEQMAARIALHSQRAEKWAERAIHGEDENARLRQQHEGCGRLAEECDRLRAEVLRLKHLDAWIEIHGLYTTAKERDEARAEVERLKEQVRNSAGYEIGRRAVEVTEKALHETQAQLKNHAAALAEGDALVLKSLCSALGKLLKPEEYEYFHAILERAFFDYRLMRGEGGEG